MAQVKFDMTGQVFGRLTVMSLAEKSIDGHIMWLCQCSCGDTTKVWRQSLVKGRTKSCGCLRVEMAKLNNFTRRMKVRGTQDNP